MFRKLLLGFVLAVVSVPAAWGGGFEFDVTPTKAMVDPGVLAPFLWVSPVMVEDAPAVSLSWSALALDKRESRIELEITPFASIDVIGHTRAIIRDVKGTISAAGEGEWTIEQGNFGNFFAFSIYIKETNRLSFLLPVRLNPQGEKTKDSFRTQLLVTCKVNEESTALSCDPPRVAFLGHLRHHFPKAPSAKSLFEEKTLPLRGHVPPGVDLVSKSNPRIPGGNKSCCHNTNFSSCKCLAECPIGDCDPNCVQCDLRACTDCYEIFHCLNGCS